MTNLSDAAAISTQNVIDAKPGTRKTEVANVFAMVASIIVSLSALVAACVIVLFAYAYKALMAGMFVLPGGAYSQAALLQPPLLTGVSAISTILTDLEFAIFGLTIAEYASAVFPAAGDYKRLAAVVIIS